MKRNLFESILFLFFQQKIDAKKWKAEDHFDLSSVSLFTQSDWLLQTNSKCSQLRGKKSYK